MAPTAARILVATRFACHLLSFLILHAQRHGPQKSEASLIALHPHSFALRNKKEETKPTYENGLDVTYRQNVVSAKPTNR